MHKTTKFILVFLSLGYALGLITLIWPEFLIRVSKFLSTYNMRFNAILFSYYYGVSLLFLTLLIFLIVLIWPVIQPDIVLTKSKNGRLALTNEAIVQFINRNLSGEGLSDVKVKFKNTKRQHKFHIIAASNYKQSTLAELPRIEQDLEHNLDELLAKVDSLPNKVNLKINQKSNHKFTRVV